MGGGKSKQRLVFSLMALSIIRRPLSRLRDSSPKRGAKGAVQLLRQCETFAAKRCPF